MVSQKKLFIIPLIIIFISFVYGIVYKIKRIAILSLILLLIFGILFFSDKVRQNYTHPRLSNLARNVIEKFNQHDIKYWADYGTLLGIVREGDVIKHDTDVDICVFPDNTDLEKKLRKIIDEFGPTYNLRYMTRGRPGDSKTNLFRIYANEDLWLAPIYCDIYLTYFQDDHYVDLSGKMPSSFLGKTKKLKWKDVDVSVPEKVHETLKWRYGDNYMTPDRFKQSERYKQLLAEEGYTVSNY